VNELQRIQDQIARSLDGEAWHGPALVEIVSGVDSGAAMARPISNAHSIWEILLHVSASAGLVLVRLRGEARMLSPEEDWPVLPTGPDQAAWEADIGRLNQVHCELIEALPQVDVSRLDAPIVPGFSSIYVTLRGFVQHSAYHANQIALIVKAL
jgi:uncharacterized damage-inducible protein DinB